MKQAISPPRVKPKLRGIPHAMGVVLAIPAAVFCVSNTQSSDAALAATVYGLSLIFLFGASTIYHTPNWTPGVRMWLRRVDHVSIFVLIAGSYTPVCLLGLPPNQGRPLLIWIWSLAALGALISLFWSTAPRWVNVGLSVVMGWTIFPFGSQVATALGALGLILLLAGGILCSIGGVMYARRAPDPLPNIFGYHEIFHTLVLVGVSCHYVVIWRLVT